MAVSIMINLEKEALGGEYIEISLTVYLSKSVDFCLIHTCYNDHGNLILISNLINGQEVNIMTLTKHNLGNNGKLTLGIKIAGNQGVTMNVQV